MYTIKRWETIKGKKFGQEKKKFNLDKIYINIEKIMNINLIDIKKDIITNKDTKCDGIMIIN